VKKEEKSGMTSGPQLKALVSKEGSRSRGRALTNLFAQKRPSRPASEPRDSQFSDAENDKVVRKTGGNKRPKYHVRASSEGLVGWIWVALPPTKQPPTSRTVDNVTKRDSEGKQITQQCQLTWVQPCVPGSCSNDLWLEGKIRVLGSRDTKKKSLRGKPVKSRSAEEERIKDNACTIA